MVFLMPSSRQIATTSVIGLRLTTERTMVTMEITKAPFSARKLPQQQQRTRYFSSLRLAILVARSVCSGVSSWARKIIYLNRHSRFPHRERNGYRWGEESVYTVLRPEVLQGRLIDAPLPIKFHHPTILFSLPAGPALD